jgi:rhodanese-related sulfurtransferase
MPTSFGRKNKMPVTRVSVGLASPDASSGVKLAANLPARLVDLRSPEVFCKGFIPGSFNVPDEQCVAAARRSGLFSGRATYLLADHPEQLQLCWDPLDTWDGTEMAGWFGPDALDEWRRASPELGSLEVISADTLTIRMAAWNTLVLDICDSGGGECRNPSHPAALRFQLDELPLSLDGLPEVSSICIVAGNNGLASYAASLLWNFGFRKVSYLRLTASGPNPPGPWPPPLSGLRR